MQVPHLGNDEKNSEEDLNKMDEKNSEEDLNKMEAGVC